MLKHHCRWMWCIAVLATTACAGEFIAPEEAALLPDDSNSIATSNGTTAATSNGTSATSNGTTACVGLDCPGAVEPCTTLPCGAADAPTLPSPTTRFARLTHRQWENTVQALFRLPELPNVAATFIADPTSTGFSTNTESLDVTPELWNDYQRGAEVIALRIASDPERLAAILPADMPSDLEGRKRAFLNDFLYRAMRRPVSSEEFEGFSRLFDSGASLLGSDDPFTAGVEMTIRAALQSPYFVFRAELSDMEENGRIALNSYEVASRLAYALWDTMPSDSVLEAASRGELDTLEGARVWLGRMLEDDKARALIASFHQEWLATNTYADITKDAGRFPGYNPDSGLHMQTEIEMFVDDVVFGQTGGFIELLTSRRTFVNANLASIYDLSGEFDDGFVAVDLNPEERSGLLTRLGFLAHNASALEQDPIHRGVFIADHILCKETPSAPPMVPPLPRDGGNTVRERVDAHTGENTCGAFCHGSFINPPGFAFENYDAVGRFQTIENGFPVDAADTYTVGDVEFSWENAVDFNAQIARSFDANACYTRQWLEYMYGRAATPSDERLIGPIAEASRRGDFSIQELLEALLLSDAFLTRAVEEETP